MSSPVPEAAARLTEDMLIEILVKLPVKSLLRFRCVCKSWFNLIKSPNFIQMHLKHHSTSKKDEYILILRSLCDVIFLSYHSSETLSYIISSPPLEIPLDSSHFEVNGPCNGLICLSDSENIIICNPAMREFKLLPPSPSLPSTEDYNVGREAIGFGYDSIRNDYKVVSFVYIAHKSTNFVSHQLEIYNLSTNSWKEYGLLEKAGFAGMVRYGTFFNGEFHWIAFKSHKCCIYSYDMNTDCSYYTVLDDGMWKPRRHMVLRVFNGSLTFWSYTDPTIAPDRSRVDVYVIDKLGEFGSFRKLFRIGPLPGTAYPVMFWKKNVFLMANEGPIRQLVECDVGTNETTELNMYGSILHPLLYQESLVSIK